MILSSIQPLINENKHLIKAVNNPELSLHLIDIDEDSDFYFKVFHPKEGKHYVEMKPANENTVQYGGWQLEAKHTPDFFQIWIDILAKYNSMQTIFDDPILKAYEDEFYEEFKIIDEGADYKPFKYETQKLIQQYIVSVKAELVTKRTEENSDRIEAIIVDCEQLDTNLTKLSQNKIVKWLSKIWAKSRKEGLDVIDKIYTDWKGDTIKKIAEYGVKLVEHYLNSPNDTPSV